MKLEMPGEDKLIQSKQKFHEGLVGILEVLPVITTVSANVDFGDTLWLLARIYYGDGQYWRELYLLNFDVIQRAQETHNARIGPDTIFPGTELRYWQF